MRPRIRCGFRFRVRGGLQRQVAAWSDALRIRGGHVISAAIAVSVALGAGKAAASPLPQQQVPEARPVIRVTDDESLRRALAAARPGDTIVIAAGTYRGLSAANVRGESGKPIVLRGEDRSAPPVFSGTVHLTDPAFLEIMDLRVEGASANGINIDDGGTFDTPAHDITLRRVQVRDCGGTANADGIKLSGVVDFVVDECTIERWGRRGSAIDMVGCARGEIRECTIRDRVTDAAASGVQAKGGSRDISIRACRFEHAGDRAVNIGGSTGLAFFRQEPKSFEAKEITVEGNTFVGSQAPIAFVGVDGAAVRFNTIIDPGKWIVRILQETNEPGFVPCRNGSFESNLVVYSRRVVGTPVNVGPGTAPDSFRFARNYWFAADDPERSVPSLPTREIDPAGGREPRFRERERGDFRQTAESPALGHGADAWAGTKGG